MSFQPFAIKSISRHTIALVGAIGVYILDTVTKRMIIADLPIGHSWPVIPGVFHLTHMQNPGAAFSLFNQHPVSLTWISAILLVSFLGFMLTQKCLSRPEMVGFSFVLGGAAGNLIDRIQRGAVTDFLDVVIIHYPVFNLADSFIFMGILLIFVAYVRNRNQTANS